MIPRLNPFKGQKGLNLTALNKYLFMDRRILIKNFMLISAGAAMLPSCLQGNGKPDLSFKNISITDKEEAMLAQISDTILPATNVTGTNGGGAHLFALMMVDECFDTDRQKKFVDGLQAFNKHIQKKSGKAFTACTPLEKTSVLKEMQQKNDAPGDAVFFYTTMKSLTIQAYTSSQYYLTKVHEYKLVPGKFYGCVPVKKTNQ